MKSIPDDVDQEKVDSLLSSIGQERVVEMPKGIDPFTLEKIREKLVHIQTKESLSKNWERMSVLAGQQPEDIWNTWFLLE